jgi:hypothetical protein
LNLEMYGSRAHPCLLKQHRFWKIKVKKKSVWMNCVSKWMNVSEWMYFAGVTGSLSRANFFYTMFLFFF